MTTIALLISAQTHAVITVSDDDGNLVTLQKPAQRVIAMAPHVAELLFAAGGGGHIIGAVSYSDYPAAAKKIPRIGDNRQIDMERVIAMRPDLIVVWRHGGSERQIEMLRKLGIPLFHSEPEKLDNIPDNIQRLGQLLGTENVAQPAAAALRQKLAALRAHYAHKPAVRMFYQIWDKPLYTINGTSIISDAIRLCGGENIFADMKIIAPVVSIESVLLADPEAIFGSNDKDDSGVNLWRQYPTMKAVRNDNLFTLDSDLLSRAGPRMIEGTAALCEKLELARQHRK
ncbi:cobalamin-binding protein [Glaciimonas soli]|uniref:ABC transporter substrate-binding protein n=1 Tax=Glaciimonas soli TaxID=2590999 RepID=A0A843YQ49_9BURK|nr:cobalamin-binding protein [Glaciimonas soli]MQR01645.1 ABC transporter substrate-binding protein [Glaciimonas soli]